jgi:hypothetical protein
MLNGPPGRSLFATHARSRAGDGLINISAPEHACKVSEHASFPVLNWASMAQNV